MGLLEPVQISKVQDDICESSREHAPHGPSPKGSCGSVALEVEEAVDGSDEVAAAAK